MTKNADPDKYEYSGYGIGFDFCSQYLCTDSSSGKHVIIFGVDNNSSSHIDDKNTNFLVLREESTQG